MKVSKWQKEEMDKLRKHYSKLSTKELAVILGRPIGQVYKIAWREGLTKNKTKLKAINSSNSKKQKNCWTENQLLILRTGVNNGIQFKELVDLIGKPLSAIQKKSRRLCLAKYMKGDY